MDTKFEDIVSEIRQVVRKYPDNYAIIEDGVPAVTYQELWTQSLCFAAGLREACCDSEYVLIQLPKSCKYIVAVLGCWLARKAFVPLGLDLPQSRMQHIVSQINSKLLITTDSFESFLSEQPIAEIVPLQPESVAYMIFSSGTTGYPKGIIVGHSGLVNLARCQRKAFGLTSKSRNLFFLSVNFDASISDILVTLTSGAALVIEQVDSVSLSANLMTTIDERQITHADLPPSLLRIIDAENCPRSLQTIIIGGESTDKDTVRKWAARVRLINVYGPTETTICTSLCQYDEDWSTPVIGKEIDEVKYHIYADGRLDADEGELWISGPCLAIGYYNNPGLTDEKFPVIDGTRYYRTSDHVRRLQNGDIAFLGRYDRQVKFHGQLVELDEVEATLKRLHFAREVAVVKRKVSDHNEKEVLVAYVKTDDGVDGKNCIHTIRRFLAQQLPAWMVPGHIELVGSLPRGVTGKVDYRVLESIQLSCQRVEDMPYNSEKEEKVARLMAEILKIPYVNPCENFFALGADSLDTLIFISRLQSDVGITITLDQLKRDASPSAVSKISDNVNSMAVFSTSLRDEWIFSVPSVSSGISPSDGVILLTGGTGFLGSHILMELLHRKEYDGKEIVCLVRCESADHGEKRLKGTLSQYGLNCDQLQRIRIIPSDISKEGLDLYCETYRYLSNNVTEIFHCAATVNMMADYGTLKASNVTGTRRILEFALTGCKKKLNYASTLSVFVSTSRNKGAVFESDCLDADCIIYGGYGQTKFVCEKMLLGVPPSLCDINIFRYGLLCGDSITGISAKKDFLGMFLRGACAVGALPYDSTNEMGIDITPIDLATRVTLDIATHSQHGIYHVAAENPLKYNHLCYLMAKECGIRIINDYEQWLASLMTFKQDADVIALEMSLCRMNIATYESMRYMDLFQTTNIRFDMALTHTLTSCRIYQDDQLISKYINYETVF